MISANTSFDPRLAGLYVITDTALCARRGLEESVAAALAGGARLVQYRDKSADHQRRFHEANLLAALCAAHGATLIINDDVKLARAVAASGVHLGKDDDNVAEARALLGEHALIGVSCYDDFTRAQRAALAGADYVAFGSVYPSSIKPDAVIAPLSLFARARRELALPVCAIGGINALNIREVVQAGANMAAVISSVFAAADIRLAAARLSRAFASSSPSR